MSGRPEAPRPSTPDQLRERAEARIFDSELPAASLAPLRARKLIHELRVHQVELELQNEELAQTQARLQGTLDSYVELYDHAPVGYVTVDRTGRILRANDEAARCLGRARSECVGSVLADDLPPQDRRFLADLLAAAFSNVGSVDAARTVSLEPDPSARVVVLLQATHASASDECRLALTDVTAIEQERARHVERLTMVERMLRLTVHRELEMISMKAAAADREAAPVTTAPAPEDVPALPVLPPQLVELLARTGDGEIEHTLLALLNLFDDLESVEQLRLMTRMKDRFIALVSHELRTPLTSISGFASTLLERWDTTSEEDRRAFVEVIDEQADRMIHLVNDVLVLARISSGELQAHPRHVNLAQAVRAAARSVRTGNGDISISCSPRLHAFVDPDHLEQALVNYLANAVKYGEPPIRVIAADELDRVQIRVVDEGPGVPDDFVPHLFAEFAQAPRSGETVQPGTGLGLSIVRQLMEAQAGSAWYQPGEPRGACFMLDLPTEPSSADLVGA